MVTQHPQLRHCVKKLEYDATRFLPDLSIDEYISELLKTTPFDFLDEDEDEEYPAMQEIRQMMNLDPEIDKYLDLRIAKRYEDPSQQWLRELCKPFAFVDESYRAWQDFAAFQKRCHESGDYLQILVYGLRNLGRLESVYTCREWYTWPSVSKRYKQDHYYDSPFGRTWNMFRAQPTSWTYNGSRPDGFDDFWALTKALALAQRRIRVLKNNLLPPIVFGTVEYATENMVECSVDVYSGLQDLTLTFEQQLVKPGFNLYGLHSLLGSMADLKTLDLSLGVSPGDSYEYLDLEQIFPAKVAWPCLTSFRVSSVSTPAKKFVQLLTVSMPKLQSFILYRVDLTEGKWEYVTECMKRSMHLQHFSDPWGCLRFLRDPSTYTHAQVRGISTRDVEQYVLRGGRHPCLLPEESDEASEKYLSAPWI